MTVLGTRPEIIRLSLIIPRLDGVCDHVVVHTGQNYDDALNDIFFTQLSLRQPDFHLGVRGESFADQVGQILSGTGELMERTSPDALLVLGDTNSGLSAIIAARLGIPTFHLEAGNRCYDDRVPEELNRRLIDHSSTVLMPYTHRSKDNLVREGIDRERIFVIGNPINEVILHNSSRIGNSGVLTELGLRQDSYFLVTMHRAENVDEESRLLGIVEGLGRVAKEYQQPVVVSLHPRTADRLSAVGVDPSSELLRLPRPFGFFDFVALEQSARCVITDSGTVQEECCILRRPNVTIRDVTERPETVECGSNILAGTEPDAIAGAVAIALDTAADWTPPAEYLEEHVSQTVVNVVLGHMLRRGL